MASASGIPTAMEDKMATKAPHVVGVMSVAHLCDLLDRESPASEEAMDGLRMILEYAEQFYEEDGDHIGRLAMAIALDAVEAEHITEEGTANSLSENMEALAHLLLVQMEEMGESWNPELVCRLKRFNRLG